MSRPFFIIQCSVPTAVIIASLLALNPILNHPSKSLQLPSSPDPEPPHPWLIHSSPCSDSPHSPSAFALLSLNITPFSLTTTGWACVHSHSHLSSFDTVCEYWYCWHIGRLWLPKYIRVMLLWHSKHGCLQCNIVYSLPVVTPNMVGF